TQALAAEWAGKDGLTLLCGRYEGVDERVLKARGVEEISVGDYVLTGGEPAAMILLDAVLRLRPGILGNLASTEEESFSRGCLNSRNTRNRMSGKGARFRRFCSPAI